MTAGRGRGPHQTKNYVSRPSVIVTKKSRTVTEYQLIKPGEGPCHDPLPVVISLAALAYRNSANDAGKDTVNTFKLC